MSKFNPELPTLPMRVGRNGLEHIAPWVQEQLAHYAYGSEVDVKVYQRRSLPHLQKYWVILRLCVSNSEGKYGRAEDLHDALKIALGYSRKVRVVGNGSGSLILKGLKAVLQRADDVRLSVDGPACQVLGACIKQAIKLVEDLHSFISETIVLPGSIAFDRMDQAAFKVYFDSAMNELRKAGYPVDDYLIEANCQLAPNKHYRTPCKNVHHCEEVDRKVNDGLKLPLRNEEF